MKRAAGPGMDCAAGARMNGARMNTAGVTIAQ